ncbi:hypothetical protein MWG84_00640 [Escherichia coli]|nr:hypothetical protein [Escherichia coli]
MADNYTQASFIIPCTQEQAKMAQEAITFVTEAEIAEGERLLDKPLKDCSLTEKLILSIIENHPEYDPSEPSFGQPSCPDCNYELLFATEVTSSGLAVFHGETIDLDHAICLTTAVLSVFDISEMVTITAAFTCSKSRTDEFGGMTILVTKDTHYYQDGCQFSRLMNEAHKAGIQYALCKVTHYHGESSYVASYVLSCDVADSAQEVVNKRLKACAGKEPEDGIYILCEEDNTSLSVELVTELSPLDYDKLSKLLPSLDTLCGA